MTRRPHGNRRGPARPGRLAEFCRGEGAYRPRTDTHLLGGKAEYRLRHHGKVDETQGRAQDGPAMCLGKPANRCHPMHRNTTWRTAMRASGSAVRPFSSCT
ncbi:hypothetical protein Slala04_69980 [Streptomyces lavendulae subsp. lavendulae]|nr:hypothetical protein Slala04_69980 [Streptomyces lavendulae subsp. lavendulae]